MLRSVAFLSHVVSAEGVEFNLMKIDEVRNIPRLLTPTEIMSFLGLVWYYRRIVDGYLSIDSPLKTLTQMNVKFELSKSCEKGFQ